MSTSESRPWPPIALNGLSFVPIALALFGFALCCAFAIAQVWLAVVLWMPFVYLNYGAHRMARVASMFSDGDRLTMVVPYMRWWRAPRRVVLRPGEYGIMSHGGGWTIVNFDVMQLRIFATGERVPLNSLFFRRREWLPVRDAIVANEKPPPPGRRHW